LNALPWQKELSRTLSPSPPDGLDAGSPDTTRLAVIGVGQRLRGDDGAGSIAAERLAARLSDPTLLVIDAGHAPENCLGPVVRFRPGVVLFIDAARVDAPPGTVVWLSAAEAGSAGGSTHTLPLSMLGAYLMEETGAAVYVVGIQPATTVMTNALSPPVTRAVNDVVDAIATRRS
jgi:hydrogenase 3 maturation protease